MLKIICLIIMTGVFVLISFNNIYAFGGKKHIDVFTSMHNVPIMFGGFGGEKNFPENDLDELQALLDITSGKNHRHDGSHDPNRAFYQIIEPITGGFVKVQSGRWNPKSVFNAIVIHNIMDMADPNATGGTNNWKETPERKLKAQKLLKKLEKGKWLYSIPEWAKTQGTEIPRRISTKVVSSSKPYLNKFKQSSIGKKVVETLEDIIPKCKIIIDKTPAILKNNGGPILFIIYEGHEIYKENVENGFDLKRDGIKIISTGLSCVVGTVVAIGVDQILTPLDYIPYVGIVLHYGGTIGISFYVTSIVEEYTSECLNYITVEYIS